jgi:hypothetical protein
LLPPIELGRLPGRPPGGQVDHHRSVEVPRQRLVCGAPGAGSGVRLRSGSLRMGDHGLQIPEQREATSEAQSESRTTAQQNGSIAHTLASQPPFPQPGVP